MVARTVPSLSLRIVFAVVLVALLAGSASAHRLRIVHTNDLHGRVKAEPMHPDQARVPGEMQGGLALLDAFLGQARREALRRGMRWLYLDGGDMFQGTPVANATEGACMVRMARGLGVVATVLGNHDFDYGLAALERRMAESRHFWLTSTVTLPFRGARARDHLIYELRGAPGERSLRIAILGATTTETPRVTLKERIRGVIFHDEVERLRPLVARLRGQGRADTVILLSHVGLDEDRRIAAELDLDLIIGGHSHTVMSAPERVGRCWIQQAGAHGHFLGVLDVELDGASGRVLSAEGGARVVRSADLPPTARGEALAAELTRDFEARMAVVVGRLGRDFPKGVRGGESPMAALCARAMLDETGAELALVNLGGVRTGLQAGTVTYGNAYEVFPFSNTMVTGHMTGREIRALLEEAVDGAWEEVRGERKERYRLIFDLDVEGHLPVGRTRGHLYVGGLRYRFDPRLPEGRRVTSLRLDDGSAVDDDRVFRVVTNNFLAEGGDGFDRIAKLANPEDRGLLDVDVLVRWLGKRSVVDDLDVTGIVNESLRVRSIGGKPMPLTRIR